MRRSRCFSAARYSDWQPHPAHILMPTASIYRHSQLSNGIFAGDRCNASDTMKRDEVTKRRCSIDAVGKRAPSRVGAKNNMSALALRRFWYRLRVCNTFGFRKCACNVPGFLACAIRENKSIVRYAMPWWTRIWIGIFYIVNKGTDLSVLTIFYVGSYYQYGWP